MQLPLVLALLCLPLASEAANACAGTRDSELTVKDSKIRLQKLQKQLAGCEYVVGNLHLTHIYQHDFDATNAMVDFSFLDTIREVTGCVQVTNVCVRKPLVFRSLRVVRGRGCANASLYVQDECPTLDVSFPALRSITSGNVLLYNVRRCYLEKLVNFSDIFQSPRTQRLRVMEKHCNETRDACHSDCQRWPGGGQFCWGPGKAQCQRRSKCAQPDKCSHCYVDGNGDEKCCSDLCLGGCSGKAPSNCYGCTRFNRNGTCVDDCRKSNSYDPAMGVMVPSSGPQLMPHGPICVSECPATYFVQDDACVSKCLPGFAAKPGSNLCVRQESMRLCDWPSARNSFVCAKDNPLLDGLRNASELCTEFHGKITISIHCFEPSGSTNFRQLTIPDLFRIFRKLRVLRGSIQFQDVPGLTNVSFLSQLTSVLKQAGQPKTGRLSILSDSIQFLGTSSLEHVENRLLYMSSRTRKAPASMCPKLFPTNATFVDGVVQVGVHDRLLSITSQLNATSSCSLDDECHPECEQRYGCWGPGPTNCVRCRGVRIGNACAASCDSVPGWYDAKRNDSRGQRVCSACHRLCSSCRGPGRYDCLRCASNAYRDGNICVDSCSVLNQFADAARVCRPCPGVCVHIHDGSATCSGNASIAGAGGCQFCARVMSVPRSQDDPRLVLRCLQPGESCTPGLYQGVFDQSDAKKLPEFNAHMVALKLTANICKRCPRRCHRCDSAVACTACRFYQIESDTDLVCVETEKPACPSEYYPVPSRKLCRKCPYKCAACDSVGCRRCTGPGFAHLNGTNGTITCLDECPPTHPHSIYNKDYKGLVCSETRFGARPAGANMTMLAIPVALTIVIIAVAVAIVCFWIRQRNHKRTPGDESFGGDDLEPLTHEEAGMNRCCLLTISEYELVRGHEVGSGAFGTVYKGEWLPEGESRRVSVAIKILSDSGDCSMSNELLEESRIMASVDHPHCVRLVGVCMTQPLQLVTHFMPLGNLRDFLRARKDTGQIGSSHLLRYAAQIASGMHYLEQKSIIHRDLACRNVLVASTKCVKITDFGLAKLLDTPQAEYQATGGKLPVKWLALECLTSRRFSHKSDVWAYGVTLWEIFTFGESPYTNVRPMDLADYLEKGERLRQPPICTLDVYMVMIKCWMLNEHNRPSFEEMEVSFKKMAAEPGRYVYIKGDRYVRNSSRDSASSGERGNSADSKSPTAVEPDSNYQIIDGVSELDNDVFEHSGAGSTLPARRQGGVASPAANHHQHQHHQQQQQQPPPPPPPLARQPSNSSSSTNSAKKQSAHCSGQQPQCQQQQQQQQRRQRPPKGDNSYTSDPCNSALAEASRAAPPPYTPPPLADAPDDYLQPIPAVPRRSTKSGSRASPGESPSIQNPEYFFANSQQARRQPPTPPRTSSVRQQPPDSPVWLASVAPNGATGERRQPKLSLSKV